MKNNKFAYLVAALSLLTTYQTLENHVSAQESETLSTHEMSETTESVSSENTETPDNITTIEESTTITEETTISEETTKELILTESSARQMSSFYAAPSVSTATTGYANSNIILYDLNGNIIQGKLPVGKKISGSEKDGWIFIDYNGKKVKFLKSFMSQTPIAFQGFAVTNTPLNSGNLNTTLNMGGFISGKYHDSGELIEFSNYGNKLSIPVSKVMELDKNLTGWINKGGYRYFIENLNNKQEVARGWKVINGSTYYFDPMMRYMYTGVKSTGENVYYFQNDGKLSSGTKTIPGTNHSNKITFGTPSRTELNTNVASKPESSFIGQAATNEALKGMGRKYYWYGTDISGTSNNNGLYCSGLVYQAYKNAGITIPGPEWGNERTARTKGPQSGPTYRGWGPAGDYGYQMVVHQYTDTHTKTGGTKFKITFQI